MHNVAQSSISYFPPKSRQNHKYQKFDYRDVTSDDVQISGIIIIAYRNETIED